MNRRIAPLCLVLLGVLAVGCQKSRKSTPPTPTLQTSTPPVPTSLRVETMRAIQAAPGFDFVQKDGALTAKLGVADGEARATLHGGSMAIRSVKGWALQVETTKLGREATLSKVGKLESAKSSGQELTLVRAGLEERFLAGPLGLEQSHRISKRPDGAGPLILQVSFQGLRPQAIDAAADRVSLVDSKGTEQAIYRDLFAVDAKGQALVSHMKVEGTVVALVIDDSHAVYPLTVDPLIASEQQKLTASDAANSDSFGISVSISGDTALVGARLKNGFRGAAYIFVRSGGSWTQQAKLTDVNGAPADFFAGSVALDGDTAVVGAKGKNANTGAAFVFTRSGTTWTEQQILTMSDAPASAQFGVSVAIDGDTAVIGASTRNLSVGAAYVYTRSSGTWTEQQFLVASDGVSGDQFGASVSVDGDTVLVGAPYQAGGKGAAYVFLRTGGTWAQQQKLVSNAPTANDLMGVAVAVSGDTALIGAPGVGINKGLAYLFTRTAGVWSRKQNLQASAAANNAYFGDAVSIDGSLAVVGAEMKSSYTGSAYLFASNGGTWSQQAQLSASDAATGDYFGVAVGVSGNSILVGAYAKNASSGAAYVFTWSAAQGDVCAANVDCGSGFCVDGVCCDTACGGSATDCQACSVAAGAAVDGTCAPLADSTSCDDANACSSGDTCTSGTCGGTSLSDGTACGNGSICSSGSCASGCFIGGSVIAADAIDPANPCQSCQPAVSSTSWTALTDATVCNDGDACTQTDTCQTGVCTGANPVTCTAQDSCHSAGTCDSSSGTCSNPANADGSSCGAGQVCASGACSAQCFIDGALVASGTINPSNACQSCQPSSSTSAWSNRADATACNDGNACTQTDTCQTGVCTGSNPKTCTALDQCHSIGTCDTGTGTCSNPPRPDSTSCNDGDACTQTDSCQTGVCTGSSPVFCAALDQCHSVGTCDSSTGTCSNPNQADGTGCDDSVACTKSDVCTSGTCGGIAYTCTVADCQSASSCNGDGNCGVTNSPSGTSCTADSNPCTSDVCDSSGSCTHPNVLDGSSCGAGQVCSAGSCNAGCFIGGALVASGTSNPANACQSCQPTSSTITWSNVIDGVSCDDGNACSSSDVCTTGVCGGNAVTCASADDCHSGSCNIQDGGCLQTALSATSCDDGRACTGPDTCQLGICSGTSNSCTCSIDSDCAAPSQCQASVSCDLSSGTCVYVNKTDATVCNDGNACTQADSCQAGACVGADPVTCTASDACHVIGSCIPADGGCTDPIAADDAGCDDGRTCTTADHCSAGTCIAGDSSTCTCTVDTDCPAPTQCQSSVSCDVSNGTCVYTNQPDATSCDDANLCTSGEVCTAGVCGTPSATITCNALDACHIAGSCDASTGLCSNPKATDGTSCDDDRACTSGDSCQAGICTSDSAGCACNSNADCVPLDQCHTAGVCDLSTGTCSNPAANDGTGCNDNDSCTDGETCQAGLCASPTSTVTCASASECSDAQTCDPSSGLCQNHFLPDGTACDSGTCESGVCNVPDAGSPTTGSSGSTSGSSGTSSSSTGGSGTSGVTPNGIAGGGCGCGSSGATDPLALLLMLGAFGMIVRRRGSKPL